MTSRTVCVGEKDLDSRVTWPEVNFFGVNVIVSVVVVVVVVAAVVVATLVVEGGVVVVEGVVDMTRR